MKVRTGNLSLLIMFMLLLAIFYVVENIIPEITHTVIVSGPLSEALDDRVAVQISDLHFESMGWREKTILKDLQKIKPALIFMTGDYIDFNSDSAQLQEFLDGAADVAPIIAIPGNNDYPRMRRLETIMAKAGIVFLKNEAAIVQSGADSIFIIGLEDNFLWYDDYFEATAGIGKSEPKILLAHAPAIVEKVDLSGIELVLAGHLHGGQLKIPFVDLKGINDVPFVKHNYLQGHYVIGETDLYVNRGIGTSYIPLRIFSRPEISIFTFSP